MICVYKHGIGECSTQYIQLGIHILSIEHRISQQPYPVYVIIMEDYSLGLENTKNIQFQSQNLRGTLVIFVDRQIFKRFIMSFLIIFIGLVFNSNDRLGCEYGKGLLKYGLYSKTWIQATNSARRKKLLIARNCLQPGLYRYIFYQGVSPLRHIFLLYLHQSYNYYIII